MLLPAHYYQRCCEVALTPEAKLPDAHVEDTVGELTGWQSSVASSVLAIDTAYPLQSI